MARLRIEVALDAEQEQQAQRLYERLAGAFDQERMRIARLLASKADGEFFGETEYQLRDMVDELGAQALEATAEERVKKGGYEAASCVCPHCQADARFVNRRSKGVVSLLREKGYNVKVLP